MHSEDRDDVWASSDEETTYDRSIAQREWDRLHEDHGNEGYKVGIIEGKEVNMQQGFNHGYGEGIQIGIALGKLQGILSSYIAFYKHIVKKEEIVAPLQKLYDELDQVEVNHVFTKGYFDTKEVAGSDDYLSPREFILQWENKVNEAIEKVRQQ
ncbi:hypothetical protein EC973_005868 [Apophysomyces ossiformis]|uniref:Protein YAE1 n=1 Tax=Apophysomyces ossiformis TaxID=679940 RepID=A0A8H7EJZ2_9FUNG|nr:hypothetical protein EC973_005868 [Apophysomyces ossiformis]